MSNIPSFSQAELLTLIRTALPQRIYTQLLDGELGEGILAAMAKLASVMTVRSKRMWDDIYYLKGSRGAYATTTATITWSAGTVEGFTIEAGQAILATRWGLRFVLVDAFTVGAGESPGATVTISVRSEYRSHEADVEAQHLDQWPEALTEGVDPASQIAFATGTTATAKAEFLAGIEDGSITILADADSSGGRLPLLDLLAQSQGVIPGENEAAGQLGLRMRRPTDVHSPAAILGAVNEVLKPYGVVATLEEPWTYALTWGDATNYADGNGAWGVAPWGRRAFFIIVVPDWGYEAAGFAWGGDTGAWGVHPWGSGDAAFEGIIHGLQDLVDGLTLAGVKGLVLSENTSVTP